MALPKSLTPCLLAALLTACSSTRENPVLPSEAAQRGLQLVRTLPAELPSELSRVPDTPYLLVFAQSTALALVDTLSPLPISVATPLAGVYQDREAAQLKDRYARVDPHTIVAERLKGSPLLTGRPDALRTMPLVYLVEANDDTFRATLVLRVEDGRWLGRYMYHLPTVLSDTQVKTAGPDVQALLRRELTEGAGVLRGLMERDARGALKGDGRRAVYGSYHLVGSRVAGMVSASVYTFPDAEVLEEGPDHVVLRSGGNPTSGAREGALAYGVHYFRRDQLHTFKPVAKAAP